ncbi:MAG: Crp/Fnr family transcriptional regulator [Gemmatimonadota bacterium]
MIEARPGREIVRQGDPCQDAWVVRSGALVMEAVDPDGRRLVLDLLGPGDLVGGVAGSTVQATVRAVLASVLMPAGPMSVRNGMERRARRAAWVACSLAWEPVAERVASRLSELAERFGRRVSGGVLVQLPLTQEDLAGLTGATRESVNRALADLAACGRITRTDEGYVVRGRLIPPRATTRPTAASSASTRRSTSRVP